MKKFWIVLTVVLCVSVAFIVYANDTPTVMVNGKLLESDIIMQNDRIYVPIRAVSESLGAQVNWDEQNNQADIQLSQEDDLSAMVAEVSKSVVAIVGNYRDGSSSQSEHVESMSHGTGVIIKSGGEILTNAHVVNNLEKIIVVMADGLGYEGKVKYMDKEMDLAVVKIDRIGLPTIKFADESEIVAGKTVAAIGTPVSFSMRNSVTKGIISGVTTMDGADYRLIQTDAAINPGNSGGPLVNTKGELLGINTVKLVSTSVEGIGFSIPVGTVKYALDQFETYGKIRRADVGAEFEESWASKLGLPTLDGLTVTNVMQGGGAQKAGMEQGDVLKQVGEYGVHSIVDYHEAMMHFQPGDTAVLTIERGGAPMQIEVVLGEK